MCKFSGQTNEKTSHIQTRTELVTEQTDYNVHSAPYGSLVVFGRRIDRACARCMYQIYNLLVVNYRQIMIGFVLCENLNVGFRWIEFLVAALGIFSTVHTETSNDMFFLKIKDRMLLPSFYTRVISKLSCTMFLHPFRRRESPLLRIFACV